MKNVFQRESQDKIRTELKNKDNFRRQLKKSVDIVITELTVESNNLNLQCDVRINSIPLLPTFCQEVRASELSVLISLCTASCNYLTIST
jgi:hypothetical protein